MKMNIFSCCIVFVVGVLFICTVNCKGKSRESNQNSRTYSNRKGKCQEPVFEAVKHPARAGCLYYYRNTACMTSTSRNGTCFTAAECTAKGGIASGSCASGYGVCCQVNLLCGGSSSQNNTYLVQASATAAPSSDPCTYTICKSNTNICRIRLDFTTFVIADPITGLTAEPGATALTANGGGIGDCTTDTFSVTSPGHSGSPIICGTNTGQHVIVDASDACNVASFFIGSSGATRQWDIKGPPGCLQYFTGISGQFSSFNFPAMTTSIPATTTHLSNQCYTMCIRQELGYCGICYVTSISNTAVLPDSTMQSSFGLSLSSDTTPQAAQDTSCSTDYLQIPGAAIAFDGTGFNVERLCGRILYVLPFFRVGNSVCTNVRPFRVLFKSDGNEVTGPATDATTNEQFDAPGGIIGFSLNYVQQKC